MHRRFRLKEQIAAAADARSGDHLNLLITHAAVTVLARRYTYGDVNEPEVDLTTLDAGFDRILLGHFHNFAKVAANAWYPGSTDTFSFKDLPAHDEPAIKGVLSLDTTAGTVIRHHPVPGGRPLRSYRLDAFDLTASRCTRPPPAWPPSRRPRGRWCGCSSTGPGRSCAASSTAASWPPTRLRRRPGRDRPGRVRRRTGRPPSWPPSP